MSPLRWAVEALGADYAQWRALVRVLLKIDLRSSSAMQMSGSAGRSRAKVWPTMLMYSIYGMFLAFFAAVVPSAYMAASVVLLLCAAIVGMAILVDFQSVIVSPMDYEILGHQPVSSRTYFLARVAGILVHTGIVGAFTGGIATIPFLVNFGALAALGWLVALAGTVVWTTLAMVFLYALILRLVSPRRLRRLLGYLQLVMAFVIFAPFLLNDTLDNAIMGMGEPPAAMLALPSTWFANLLPLAAGQWSTTGALIAVAALASIVVQFRFVAGRLSLSYSEQLGAMLATSGAAHKRAAGGRLRTRWFSPELRVVSTLVRGQFRDDMNFRMGVLGILPITLIYVFMSIQDGSLRDPFVHLGYDARGLGLVHFAALGMPVILMEQLFRSQSYKAAWVFFSTPVDRAKLVGNVGNSVAFFFLLPYLAMLAGVFAWAFGHVWHAVIHATALGLISLLSIQLLLLASPRLPFAQPPRTGARMSAFLSAVFISMFAIGLLPLVLGPLYARPLSTAVGMTALAGAALVAPRIVTRGIRDRVERLEFAG